MKPILFLDFDGTICFDKYWRSLPADQYEKVQELIFGKNRLMLKDWMVGKYSAEEINKYLSQALDIEYKSLWELFVKDCETMHVSENVLEKIDSLRTKYITILITGNMDSFTRFTVPALKLDTYFDYINNSSFDGKHEFENGGEIFQLLADGLGSTIQSSFLIDDSVKNCESFNDLGGTTYLIEPNRDVNYCLDLLANKF